MAKNFRNLTYITHHLEVVFWKTTIPLLGKRRSGKQRRLDSSLQLRSIILAATGCLVLLLAAWSVSHVIRTDTPGLSQNNHRDGTFQKILIVLVKELPVRKPLLEAVWLVTAPTEQPAWMMTPIFPASLKGGEEQDSMLARAFRLGLRGSLGEEFRRLLQEREIAWDSVIVLDEYALAGYIDLLGGVRVGLSKLDGSQAIAQVLSSQASSQQLLIEQAALIRSLCDQSVSLFRDIEPQVAIDRFWGHLYTDHPSRQLTENWLRMRENGYGLVCEFPTLQSNLSILRP